MHKMFIHYIMLLLLGFAIVGGCILCKKKKLDGRKSFVIAILTYIIGFITIVQMLYFPLFYDEFTITAMKDKHEMSTNSDVFVYGLVVDKKEIQDIKIAKGLWIDDGEYLVYSPEYEDVTKKIIIKVPVGKERNIIFSKAPFCGVVQVEDGKLHSMRYELYSSENKAFYASLPSSDSRVIIVDRISRIGIFMVLLLMEQIIIISCINLGWSKSIKILSNRKVYYVLFLMFGFFVFYLRYTGTPEQVIDGGYQNVYYFENYELGYLSRGFIGEVLNSIIPYWSQEALFVFKSSIALVFFLIVSICVAEIISRWEDKWMAMLMMGIVLAYPWARLIFRDDLRSDICVYLFYIISVWLIYRAKASMIFVPLLSAFIVLTNETTCLTVIPSIFMLVLYRLCKTKEKKYAGILGGIVFSTIVLTGINLICGKGGNIELLDSFENMQVHFEGVLGSSALAAEYYVLEQHLELTYSDYLSHWFVWLGVSVICIPMFYLLGIFIKNIYFKYIAKYELKVQTAFTMLILCSFTPISAMMIAIDHPRYINLIFIILLGHILFLMAEGNVQISMNEMHMFQDKTAIQKVLPITIVFFYFLIETFAATNSNSLPQIDKWFRYFGG